MGRGNRVPRSFLLFSILPHSNITPRWPDTLTSRGPRRFHLQPGTIDSSWAWTDELLLGEWALKQNFGSLYPKDDAAYTAIVLRLSVVRTASAMRIKLQRMSANGRRSGLLSSLAALTTALHEHTSRPLRLLQLRKNKSLLRRGAVGAPISTSAKQLQLSSRIFGSAWSSRTLGEP